MTFQGITIDDTDSLDAAADLRESYDAYLMRLADELATESVVNIDDFDGDDPDDPSPIVRAAAPGSPCHLCDATGTRRIWTGGRLADWIEIECGACNGTGITPVPTSRCQTCRDTGRIVKPSAWFAGKTIDGFCPDCTPHFDFTARQFRNCGGSADPAGEQSPAPVPFDHAAHCRKIASYGGLATYRTHGSHHMRVIGQTGVRVTIERYGYDYWRGIMDAKGWQRPRQVCFLDDLRAGRELAALERLAA
jgi:hypothetical protein